MRLAGVNDRNQCASTAGASPATRAFRFSANEIRGDRETDGQVLDAVWRTGVPRADDVVPVEGKGKTAATVRRLGNDRTDFAR
uniref:hypothetical protein n=1 Tax=Amycolatopsis sp. CA-096443 TaxID=3239919 RepID=UPI003F49ABF5